MREHTTAIVGALIVGAIAGYLFGARGTMVEEQVAMQHAGHAMIEVDAQVPTPSVRLEAIADSKDGYNLHIVTENYRFDPAATGSDPVANTGHAHLFVNGMKVARVYGEWFHLGAADLRDGENEVLVTLNANDHSEWVRNGMHISDAVMLIKSK